MQSYAQVIRANLLFLFYTHTAPIFSFLIPIYTDIMT